MQEDFAPGWQARAGARQLANQIELNRRRNEHALKEYEPLLVLGRYVRRSRRYLDKNQRELASATGLSQTLLSRLERGAAPAMRLDRFVGLCTGFGRLFPLGACPHDHPCAWQRVRPPAIPVETDGFLEYLLSTAGENPDPGPGAHDAHDLEIEIQLDQIRG